MQAGLLKRRWKLELAAPARANVSDFFLHKKVSHANRNARAAAFLLLYPPFKYVQMAIIVLMHARVRLDACFGKIGSFSRFRDLCNGDLDCVPALQTYLALRADAICSQSSNK